MCGALWFSLTSMTPLWIGGESSPTGLLDSRPGTAHHDVEVGLLGSAFHHDAAAQERCSCVGMVFFDNGPAARDGHPGHSRESHPAKAGWGADRFRWEEALELLGPTVDVRR
ncbi:MULTISPECIES: hypothetical protein [unclassified Streptomyces]|uniref:hypothetical protein n=1 Tax=unclassified Streptomyces TaxID=2593676 RepID=UPI002E2A14AD|nr:hypothetical protein [Streptomyces sp. NBC_00223]